MQLKHILAPDCTRCAVEGQSKKKILQLIANMAATHLPGMTTQDVFDCLLHREKLGSTGIGCGIAIPHGKLSKGSQVVAVLITTSSPISFDAIDHRPVDIFFALLVPEAMCKEHLQTLSNIAKFLNNKERCRRLRKATSDQELFNLIQEDESLLMEG